MYLHWKKFGVTKSGIEHNKWKKEENTLAPHAIVTVVEKRNLDLAKITKSHSAYEATLQYHLGNSQHFKQLGRWDMKPFDCYIKPMMDIWHIHIKSLKNLLRKMNSKFSIF